MAAFTFGLSTIFTDSSAERQRKKMTESWKRKGAEMRVQADTASKELTKGDLKLQQLIKSRQEAITEGLDTSGWDKLIQDRKQANIQLSADKKRADERAIQHQRQEDLRKNQQALDYHKTVLSVGFLKGTQTYEDSKIKASQLTKTVNSQTLASASYQQRYREKFTKDGRIEEVNPLTAQYNLKQAQANIHKPSNDAVIRGREVFPFSPQDRVILAKEKNITDMETGDNYGSSIVEGSITSLTKSTNEILLEIYDFMQRGRAEDKLYSKDTSMNLAFNMIDSLAVTANNNNSNTNGSTN